MRRVVSLWLPMWPTDRLRRRLSGRWCRRPRRSPPADRRRRPGGAAQGVHPGLTVGASMWKSSSGRIAPRGSRCCPGAGSSSAPSVGWAAAGASPRMGEPQPQGACLPPPRLHPPHDLPRTDSQKSAGGKTITVTRRGSVPDAECRAAVQSQSVDFTGRWQRSLAAA